MKPSHSSEHDEHEREIIEILKELGRLNSAYPPELMAARRAAFLSQVERLGIGEAGEEWSAEDQKIVNLLGALRSAQVDYPADLLAARRSALLSQIDRAVVPSVWDQFRISLHRLFPSKTNISTVRRISFVLVSLLAAVLFGSFFFSRAQQSLQTTPYPTALEPTSLLPTHTSEVAITICKPGELDPACPPGELVPSQDLAYTGNGSAQPAVSSQPDAGGDYKAASVNDGRDGASWVSNRTNSWIKIDLGQVTTINTVSLQKGSPGPAQENQPGQFVIAVALVDVYGEGDGSDDSTEYTQVFRSEHTGFSGIVSEAETIKTQFPPVRARFVKITFEKAGAAIENVGVFMVQPPVLAARPTRGPTDDPLAISSIAVETNTVFPMDTAASIPTITALPEATNTPAPLPTSTLPPVDTATPVPTEPMPTATAIPPTAPPTPASPDILVVAGHDQTLTFTCNGNAAEIRGHANTVTLLGSCSGITVTGNRNQVFWQSGSPVITNTGRDNIIQQL